MKRKDDAEKQKEKAKDMLGITDDRAEEIFDEKQETQEKQPEKEK